MNKNLKMSTCGILGLFFLVSLNSYAQTEKTEPADSQSKNIIKVEATEEAPLASGAMPNIYKGKIYGAKKTKITNFSQSVAAAEANNIRQTLHESSGVIVTEVNNQSFYSIGIRGIGDPHESQSVLIMSDDIPIAADFYGYPAVYFLPSQSSVESVEVTKTGAGLLYGSQPGGSLNYRLKQSQFNSKLELKTINTFGTDQLFTTFNSLQGGSENFAYRVEAYQRSGDGAFQNNSGFNAYGLDSRIRYKINDRHEIKNSLSFYKGRFEEPGGLALVPAAGRVSIAESRTRNTLQHDKLLIDRIEARVVHEYKNDSQLNVTSVLWANNMSRESRRQNGGGFGVLPTSNSNTIQDQDFYSTGVRVGLIQDYNIGENNNSLTANVTLYDMNSPIEFGTGSSADADKFSTLNRELARTTKSGALAVENQFNLSAWTVTPGLRFESIQQNIKEKFNNTPNLRNTSTTDKIVLGALGITYATESLNQVYLNVAEGFRPIQYSEAVPTSSNTFVNEDLKSSKTISTEIGLKGQAQSIDYDVSVFAVNYKNQLGTVTSSSTTNLGNVGEGQYEGLDLSVSSQVNTLLKVFANSQFLKAHFVKGPLDTKTPAFAPSYMHKLGFQYENDLIKSRVTASFLAEHYSDDNNTTERKIPSYSVWDYSGEFKLEKKFLNSAAKINYGVNNIFDAQYYTRVRSNGIEPALDRNYYAGFELNY